MYKNNFNRQKVMDTIRKYNQGYQSTDDGNCKYRTNEEEYNCCLVGCFIPDNRYDESMEDHDANHVITTFNLENDMPLKTDLMEELQIFHDEELNGFCGNEFYSAIEQKLIDMENNY